MPNPPEGRGTERDDEDKFYLPFPSFYSSFFYLLTEFFAPHFEQ